MNGEIPYMLMHVGSHCAVGYSHLDLRPGDVRL